MFVRRQHRCDAFRMTPRKLYTLLTSKFHDLQGKVLLSSLFLAEMVGSQYLAEWLHVRLLTRLKTERQQK